LAIVRSPRPKQVRESLKRIVKKLRQAHEALDLNRPEAPEWDGARTKQGSIAQSNQRPSSPLRLRDPSLPLAVFGPVESPPWNRQRRLPGSTLTAQGMVPKNQVLIRQVLHRGVWARMVNLPWVLMKQARLEVEHAPLKAAVTAQLAVAIAILTVAPIRLGNLGRTRLGENLIKPAGLGAPYWLVFPDHDVKNTVPLQFKLDQHRSDLIDEYIHDFRAAALRGSNEPWLFPGENGGHKGLAVLGSQITKCILTATGVQMTTHQFRHAAGAILLKHRPGEYELVRRLLGHRSIETTKNAYVGLETIQATEIFSKIIRDQLAFEPEDA
jgi:Phage integrase family